MKMSQRSRKEYLEQAHKRYAGSGLAYKSRIIDEFCLTSGYERKHAIKLMRGKTDCRKGKGWMQETTSAVNLAALRGVVFDRLVSQSSLLLLAKQQEP